MRRLGFLAFGVIVVTLLGPAGPVSAKGSSLRFERESYAPGETATAIATVDVWPASGQPEDGPYAVYLVRGQQPLWYGHLPNRAVHIGELDTRGLTPTRTRGTDTSIFNVKLTIEVPNIRDGVYAVWVCRKECGANSGFGDLVYGLLVISTTVAIRGDPRDAMDGDGTTAWLLAAFAVLVAIASGFYVVQRRAPMT